MYFLPLHLVPVMVSHLEHSAEWSVALLPRGRLVTQRLKKTYAFLLRQKYGIHSVQFRMQNKGVISALPNIQGCVQLHLKLLLDKWLLSLTEGFL